jgi:hypothetical protein
MPVFTALAIFFDFSRHDFSSNRQPVAPNE